MKQLNSVDHIGVNSIRVHVTDGDGATLGGFPRLDQVLGAYIRNVLESHNIDESSRILGISRSKVYKYIRIYSLETPRKGKIK